MIVRTVNFTMSTEQAFYLIHDLSVLGKIAVVNRIIPIEVSTRDRLGRVNKPFERVKVKLCMYISLFPVFLQ